MRAVVYRGVNDLRLETVPVPRLGAHELLVKVAVCGVCPTDIKKIQHGTVPPPRIFGHETAGTIVKIGRGGATVPASHSKSSGGASVLTSRLLSRFKVGDRVALHHHVPCLDCHYCRHASFAQCETYRRTGITAGFEPAGGGYAEYVRVMPFVLPGVVKIPDQNSFEEGAMLEPVNTVLKAVRRLNLLRGDAVLVAGQGPIGLMFTLLLQLAGARVLATDLMASRLKLARQFGAKWTLNVGQASSLSPSERKSGTGKMPVLRAGFDAAIVAVPSDAAVQQALQRVRGGGQVLLFAHTKRSSLTWEGRRVAVPELGMATCRPSQAKEIFNLDLASIWLDEKDLIGSYSSDFTLQAEVARLVFSRRLDVRPLLSHRFPLEQTAAAIRLAANPRPDSLKIVVAADMSRLKSHRNSRD